MTDPLIVLAKIPGKLGALDAERERLIQECLKAGCSWRQIAEALGYANHSWIYRRYKHLTPKGPRP